MKLIQPVLLLSFILILNACANHAKFSESFHDNFEEYDSIASDLSLMETINYIENQESRTIAVYKGGEIELFNKDSILNGFILNVQEFMTKENILYIIREDDRIIFDFTWNCHEALYFFSDNMKFYNAYARSDKWSEKIDSNWVLIEGECYSIE